MEFKHTSVLIFIVMMVVVPLLQATSPTYMKATNVTLSIPCTINGAVCNSSAVCVATVLNPQDTILYNQQNMAQNGAVFDLNLTESDTNLNGEYRLSISCTQGGESSAKDLTFYVTENGESFTSAQPLALLPIVALIGILFGIGFTFSRAKWKLKSFFYGMALLATIILINSTMIMFSVSENLVVMGERLVVLGIVVFSFYVLFLLINFTIEAFDMIKKAKQKKVEKSDPY